MNIPTHHHSPVPTPTRAVRPHLPYHPNSTSTSKNAIRNGTFATTVRNRLFFFWIFNGIVGRNINLGVLHVTWSLRVRMFCCIISVHIVRLLRRGRSFFVSMRGVRNDIQRYGFAAGGGVNGSCLL